MIIAWVASIWVISGKKAFSDGVIILAGLIIFILCAMLADFLSKRKRKHGMAVNKS